MKSALRVIAGHGGQDTGTVSGDLVERDLTIAVVLAFNDYATKTFRPHDVTIVAIGPDDPRDGERTLEDKINDANAAGADQVLIEVHFNANASGDGAQLWYSQNAKTTPGDETWVVLPHLARELGFLLGEAIPQLDSSRSRFGKLGILDDVTCTAVLIEARNLAQVVDVKDFTYSVGAAIAKAMAAYFGWPPAVEPPAPAPVVDAKLATAKRIASDAAAAIEQL